VVTEPYYEAVRTGQYEKPTGLKGKYDNVRRYWEDEVTQLFLRPYLESLIAEKKEKNGLVRILDLGCGSADGYDFLTNIPASGTSLSDRECRLIIPDTLGIYAGFDVNPVLIEKGKSLHSRNGSVELFVADFSQGLPPEVGETPYDLYFTSYGTLSHNEDEQSIKLLSDIAKHSGEHSLVVGDWLGRYSYEWQSLWTEDLSNVKFMDYVISYIYSAEERVGKELEHFPLRLMSRQEIENVITAASERAGIEIKSKKIFDRSVFVGRHTDTAEYNEHCPSLRKTVNSLFEIGVRTDLEALLFDYHPEAGFDSLNDFFRNKAASWNALVQFTIDLLHSPRASGIPAQPGALQKAMQVVKRAVESAAELEMGDPKANIIEPQLAYALRGLEMGLQQGMGVGHGLVAIMEIRK
jgi:SAM-dependent methyltransferase